MWWSVWERRWARTATQQLGTSPRTGFPREDERSINQAVRPNGGGQLKNQNCPSLPSHRTGGDAGPVPSTGVTPKAPQDTATSGWSMASLCFSSLEVLQFFRKVSWGSLEVWIIDKRAARLGVTSRRGLSTMSPDPSRSPKVSRFRSTGRTSACLHAVLLHLTCFFSVPIFPPTPVGLGPAGDGKGRVACGKAVGWMSSR